MTLQSEAVTAAFKCARAISGRSVVYARGANSVTLSCVPGRTQFAAETGDGIIDYTNTDDYLFLASELILNSVLVTPLMGDTVTDAGVTRTVFSTAGDARFRYTDQEKKIIRIHTRAI